MFIYDLILAPSRSWAYNGWALGATILALKGISDADLIRKRYSETAFRMVVFGIAELFAVISIKITIFP